MARPLRIEFPDAVYHVTSRGDRHEPIFRDDVDRQLLLHVVDQAMARLDAHAIAYCLMGNHYHFVLRTRQPNLSRLMRQLNGEYTRAFNRRHGLTGHLFQGRFHAVLVDRDAYLIEVCRYVELNPVRARLVESPADWRWSSYRAHVGVDPAPAWLATVELHGHLLERDALTQDDRRLASDLYAQVVADGLGVDLWSSHLRNEIYLGGERFVGDMQAIAQHQRLQCVEIAKEQRKDMGALGRWMTVDRPRDESFRMAYTNGGLTMSEIARQAGLSLSAVSRLISNAERRQDSRPDTAKFKT